MGNRRPFTTAVSNREAIRARWMQQEAGAHGRLVPDGTG
jgi:hypothetical protein